MNAADFEKTVYRYLDGTLDAAGVRALNGMIQARSDWAALFVELTGQDALLVNLYEGEKAVSAVGAVRNGMKPVRGVSPWPRRWAGAIVAAAAGALMVFGLWRFRSDVTGDRVAADMRIESLRGNVYVLRAGEDGWGVERQVEDGWGVERQAGEDGWGVERDGAPVRRLPAVAGMLLGDGDRVLTGPDSEVVLAASDIGLSVRMEAVADLALTRVSERFFLASGRVAVAAQQQAKRRMVWETARARAEVVGTRFEIDARPESTQLTVLQGVLDFTDVGRDVSVRVTAGHYAMVIPGAELIAVPIGTDLPTEYFWGFSEPPDPEVFRVHKGKWRRASAGEWESVSGEKSQTDYLKSESDQVVALLNAPLHRLPVLVTYEQSFVQKDLSTEISAGSGVGLNRAQACVEFPVLTGDSFTTASRKGRAVVHRIRVRAYVTEDSVDLWQARGRAGRFERHHVLLYEGADPSRLALNFAGPLYTSFIRVQPVDPGEIPDLSEWRRTLGKIPPDKRVGKVTFPDWREGRRGQEMHAVFHAPFRMTDSDY